MESLDLLLPVKQVIAKRVISHLATLVASVPWSEDDVVASVVKTSYLRVGISSGLSRVVDLCLPVFGYAKLVPSLTHDSLATELAMVLQADTSPFCQEVWSVRGYVNFNLRSSFLGKIVDAILDREYLQNLPPKKTALPILVEFSQPNTHKEFHVGHLWNVALGDCLVRILTQLGNRVIAANYFGDEGKHVATCLWQLSKDPETKTPPTAADLGRVYVRGHAALVAEPTIVGAEIDAVLKRLEEREPQTHLLWSNTRQLCLDEFEQHYKWLQVEFDPRAKLFCESDFSGPSLALIKKHEHQLELLGDGAAIGVDFAKHGFPYLPPLLLRKSNGSGLYATKDLALALHKFQTFGALQQSIVIVSHDQILHFRQVFQALALLGYKAESLASLHVPYGLVKVQSGQSTVKMSSRQGTTIPFTFLRSRLAAHLFETTFQSYVVPVWSSEQFIRYFQTWLLSTQPDDVWTSETIVQAINETAKLAHWTPAQVKRFADFFVTADHKNTHWNATKVNAVAEKIALAPASSPLWSPSEISHAIHILSLATIKYGMLRHERSQDITFSMSQWAQHTGDTGPYLIYAFARMRAILRKISEPAPAERDWASHLTLREERILLLSMTDFWSIVRMVADSFNPALLCSYLSGLCRTFSTWYESVPSLKDEVNAAVLIARLRLVRALSLLLQRGLFLLGIPTVERL